MIYFDNAATSHFKPKSVINAVNYELKHAANPGRSSHAPSLSAANKISNTRDILLEYFNAPYHNAVFTKNCTEALNLALGVINHGHVIITVNEHNSVLRPLYRLVADSLITVSIVYPDSNGYISPLSIERKIKKNTVMIVASHVSNVTGFETDLYNIGKIAYNHGIIFLVDAAQSAGHIPIDMDRLKIDMLAAPAHKGLYGVQGCGFLISNNALSIPPIILGGTGTESNNIEQPTALPQALESGTLNTPSISALCAAIKWTRAHQKELSLREQELTGELVYGLKNTGKTRLYSTEEAKGVVSFNVRGYACNEVSDFLAERDICVRSGLHCAPLIHKYLRSNGTVRVSLGADNTLRQIRTLLTAIEDFLKSVSRG